MARRVEGLMMLYGAIVQVRVGGGWRYGGGVEGLMMLHGPLCSCV